MKKPYIKTEVENIFRVKMYAPIGFCLPYLFYSISKHKAWDYSHRIKIKDDLIYYIFEFKNILLNEQKNMRKFCRDSMRKDMISIREYEIVKKRIDRYKIKINR